LKLIDSPKSPAKALPRDLEGGHPEKLGGDDLVAVGYLGGDRFVVLLG